MPSKATATRPQAAGDMDTRRRAAEAAFIQLVNQVPDAPEGDFLDLLGPILAAASWEVLADNDKLPSSKTLVGVELKLDSIAKKVSDKKSITGYYLFCEGVNLATGEPITWTAGGGQAVAVMSKLHALKALPAKIVYRSVETRGEGDAINCEVLDVYQHIVDA